MKQQVTEIDAQRKEIKLLREKLRQSAQPGEGILPTGMLLSRLQQKWLPAGAFVCRGQRNDCCPSSCGNRCNAEYWLGHSESVASLMRNLALLLGADPNLYQAAGEVHDLDYVRAPHDLGSKNLPGAHPVPIVIDLMEMGAPPVLSLAVLEHSPHLNLRPSSRLSEALIACDDAVTLASIGHDMSAVAGLPAAIIQSINDARPGKIQGKHRNGMPRRMNRAFSALTSKRYAIADSWSGKRN
jgi:hypothetical protein